MLEYCSKITVFLHVRANEIGAVQTKKQFLRIHIRRVPTNFHRKRVVETRDSTRTPAHTLLHVLAATSKTKTHFSEFRKNLEEIF